MSVLFGPAQRRSERARKTTHLLRSLTRFHARWSSILARTAGEPNKLGRLSPVGMISVPCIVSLCPPLTLRHDARPRTVIHTEHESEVVWRLAGLLLRPLGRERHAGARLAPAHIVHCARAPPVEGVGAEEGAVRGEGAVSAEGSGGVEEGEEGAAGGLHGGGCAGHCGGVGVAASRPAVGCVSSKPRFGEDGDARAVECRGGVGRGACGGCGSLCCGLEIIASRLHDSRVSVECPNVCAPRLKH